MSDPTRVPFICDEDHAYSGALRHLHAFTPDDHGACTWQPAATD
jgi:hypothetical protein